MLQVLRDTCLQYAIYLRAAHIKRKNNEAADSLSKSHISDFRELVPNATRKSKKTKKLLFYLPIAESDLIESKPKTSKDQQDVGPGGDGSDSDRDT